MTLNRLTLAFTGPDTELERFFLEEYSLKSLAHIRFALLMAAILIGSFGILDAYIVPGQTALTWTIRYAILCPGALLLALASYHPRVPKYMPVLLTAMLLLTGLGFIAMVLYTSVPANYLYYTGLIQVLMYGYTFIRLRFVWGSLAGFIIIVLYEAAVLLPHNETPAAILLNNGFFLITSNVIGMMAAYSIEYYARRDFYLARRLTEEQENVLSANVLLESRIRERTAELADEHAALMREIEDRHRLEAERFELERRLLQSQKMESLGVMAGGIAHDFNNILTSLLGNTELARRRLEPGSPLIKYLERMQAASERARTLVQQILTFSRRNPSERRIVSIRPLLDEVVELLRPVIPSTVTIETRFCPDELVIDADPTQIHQVLVNLCINAAQAMEIRGGQLSIREQLVVLDGLEPDRRPHLVPGSYLALSVSDTGEGIDPEVLPRIFEPFFTTKDQGKGTGLGLAVAYGIVTDHGGVITVESEPGRGARFDVYLPLADNRANQPKPARTGRSVDCTSCRVLLVDDQPDALESVRELVQDLNMPVTAFADPIEAERAFRHAPGAFDLLISDLTMPKMSGLELAKACTAVNPNLAVILITGYRAFEDPDVLKQCGVHEVLSKPFRQQELVRTITKCLLTRSGEGR